MAAKKRNESLSIERIADDIMLFNAKAPVKPPLASIKLNTKYNILDFGPANNFPQELIRAINSSPTARACTKSHSKFIAGDGFIFPESDPAFWAKVSNVLTSDLLQKSAYDYTYFEAIALHLVFNMNGELIRIKHVDTSTVRLGEPNDFGEITYCKISPDWENLTGKFADLNKPVLYDLYDPIRTKETLATLAQDAMAFKDWGGCILYARRYSPGQPYYITPSYSASLNYIYTDGQIQDFHANNIDNAFMPSVLIYVPGELKGEVEDKETGEKVSKKTAFQRHMDKELLGAKNGGKPAYIYGKEGSQPIITQFTANTNHELFITLSNLITESITRAFQIPQVLAGIKTSGQLGTSNEISNAIELYYNTVIKDDVNFITSIYNDLVKLMPGYVEGEVTIANSKPFNYIDTAFKDDFTLGERREASGYSPEMPKDEAIQLEASTERTSQALSALSPLVANKVLESMTPDEIRQLVALPPAVGGNKLPEVPTTIVNMGRSKING